MRRGPAEEPGLRLSGVSEPGSYRASSATPIRFVVAVVYVNKAGARVDPHATLPIPVLGAQHLRVGAPLSGRALGEAHVGGHALVGVLVDVLALLGATDGGVVEHMPVAGQHEGRPELGPHRLQEALTETDHRGPCAGR